MPQPSPPPFLAGRSSIFAYGCPKPASVTEGATEGASTSDTNIATTGATSGATSDTTSGATKRAAKRGSKSAKARQTTNGQGWGR